MHEFVIMPNHFHLLLTPSPCQFIKGGTARNEKLISLWKYVVRLGVSTFVSHLQPFAA